MLDTFSFVAMVGTLFTHCGAAHGRLNTLSPGLIVLDH